MNSILVNGIIKNKTLAILVDSESTHSLIDEQAVNETGYAPIYSPSMRVTVADGNYVMCNACCMGFSWNMGGKSFQEDLMIINLGGCDMVLGNDWMKKYNSTKFDHEKNTVIIGRKGNKTVLYSIIEEGRLNMIADHLFMVTLSPS